MGNLGPGEVLQLSAELKVDDAGKLGTALGSVFSCHGFSVDRVKPDKILITPDARLIELEATHMGLRKRLSPEAQIKQGIEYDAFNAQVREAFDNVDSQTFFSPAEISMLTHRVLSYIKIYEDFAATLRQRAGVVHFELGDPLLATLFREKVLEQVMCVHDPTIHQTLMPKFWSAFPDSSRIQQYYGDSIALYFEWMQFMCSWLAIPGIAGLVIYVAHVLTGETVEDSRFAPVYSVGMILWAVLFTKFWQRREAHLSVVWGTAWSSAAMHVRAEFKGHWRTSPVTGQREIYFAPWRRWPRYALSAVVTGALLSCAFTVMICSLNLQGYIQDPDDEFYIAPLASLAAPGGLFHHGRSASRGLINQLLPNVPILMHIAVIVFLNQVIYRRVAVALTHFENHRTDDAHRASLVVKRFLFEAFDCYVALFYLAFWQLDIMKVRAELRGMFAGDCARRLATEVLLPWLLQRISAARQRGELAKMESALGDKPAQLQALADEKKEEYDDFDDYMEMCIQFGYVCLFAAAMPVAAAVAAVYTIVEMRSDLIKLLHLCRRPAARRTVTIGAWRTVVQVQAWLAILTNCVVFAFSSDQVIEFAPQLFQTLRLPRGGLDKVVAEGSGRWLVTIWVVVEHSIVLVALLLWWVIPSVPASVEEAVARVWHEQERDAIAKRHDERTRIAAEARAARSG